MSDQYWLVREDEFDAGRLNHSETIFTQGNGYFGTRGAFEEHFPGEERATFVHGVFDDVPIVFTEMVNFPDWTEMEIILAGERFTLTEGQVLSYQRMLDLRNGLLRREVRWRSPAGRVTHLCFERFASLAEQHLAVVRVSITPEDYSGMVDVRTGWDAGADNLGLKHWDWQAQSAVGNIAWVEVKTHSTGIVAALGMRLHVDAAKKPVMAAWDVHGHPTLTVQSTLKVGETVRVEKVAMIVTSREAADPRQTMHVRLSSIPVDAWEALWQLNAAAWKKEWELSDVVIEGDAEAQLALRFNIFQLLIAAPRHDERVNIGAKTLSGYGYRGHAFWDTEIFMLPFFIYTRPELARNLLSYRYHMLAGARNKAAANGWRGAQFPWESAATGEEVTPTWVPHFKDHNRMVRIWTGDIEIHISADVAYAVWLYWQVSGDEDFLLNRGAQVILETARFWAARAEWDAEAGRYEYNDVIGPDEYHDHVDNNAYTNYLARWNLTLGGELLGWMKAQQPRAAAELVAQLELGSEELAHWQEVAAKLYCPLNKDTKLVEQFEGYFRRSDVDLRSFEPRTESVQALLGIEGTNETQLIKQPDVLMLACLFPDFFNEEVVRSNYDYYTPRTDHTYGSSLGPSIQAIMACRMGYADDAYEHFMRAARADLNDVRGNAGDGIHGASAGGLWQAVVFGFAGLRLEEGGVHTQAHLPAHWRRVAFKVMWHDQLIPVEVVNPEVK